MRLDHSNPGAHLATTFLGYTGIYCQIYWGIYDLRQSNSIEYLDGVTYCAFLFDVILLKPTINSIN